MKRRRYQRHSTLKSAGSGPPIQASQSGRGGNFLCRETFNLDAHDAERGLRRAGDVELGPGIDLDFAIGGVVQALCALWLAVGRVVGQPKRLTVQTRPSATSVLLRSTIDHAVFGQAHQQIGVDGAARQGFQIVAAVERHYRPWRVGRSGRDGPR